MRYLSSLLVVAVSALTVSCATGAYADSAVACPADSRRFDYSGLLLCWPTKDETVEITLYESLGLTVSEKWIGNEPVRGHSFDAASQRNKIWPSGGTMVNVDFVPIGHWKASVGGSSQLVDLLGRILLQPANLETVGSFTVATENEGTLVFTRIGGGVFAASRPIPWFQTPRGKFEYRARISGHVADYVMRCLVKQDPGWAPIACRTIWLTDQYAMVGTMTSDTVDAAMMVYEKMRQEILGYLIKPKLTLP
jgi:hypothetical protein